MDHEPIEAKYGFPIQGRSKEIADRISYLKDRARGDLKWVVIDTGMVVTGIILIPHIHEPAQYLTIASVGILSAMTLAFAGRGLSEILEASALTTTLANHYLDNE